MKFPQQMSSALPGLVKCNHCNHDLPHPAQFALRYFDKVGELNCGHCGIKIDWWNAVMQVLKFDFPLLGDQAYALLGAQVTLIRIELAANQTKQVNFLESDVPEGSHIVCINYTPQDGVFPLEVHGNQPIRREYPTQVTLFGRPVGNPTEKNSKIDIAVTWVPKSINFPPWLSLIEALDAFAQERYIRMIIPANVSVEALTRSVLWNFMTTKIPKKQIDDFLSNAASYSYQLNVLLPIFADFLGLQPIPDKIRGALNKLRKLRNEVAHGSEEEIKLDKHEATELLCGTLMGFSYCLYVKSRLALN